MECIDSRFEVMPCGCKFLIRANDDSALLVEIGTKCNDPYHTGIDRS